MRRMLTIKAKPGMVVAGDVYTEDNKLVITKGTVLDSEIIDKLKYYSIFDFFVEEDKGITSYDSEDLEHMIFADDVIDTDRYYNRIKASEEFQVFEEMFEHSLEKVKDSINDAVTMNKQVNINDLLDSVRKITDEFKPDVSIFDMLHCVEDYDDLTYAHSVNVGLISRIIGKWAGMPEDDVDILTICGLLHDIGKVMIPNDVITKPGRLTPTEFAIVKTHPIHGYNILKNQDFDERIKLAALQHHEKANGSGYPSGLKFDDIDPFARIVTIADIYDAMTSTRVYRKGMCPFEVISIFEKNIDDYDTKILLLFLNKIAESFMGADVLINNDLEGKIVMINKYSLGKPGVLAGGAYLDLSKEENLSITALV